MAGVSADASGQARTPRTPRVRRQRGARESLASIVLGFESIVVFLAGLTVFGLRALPEQIPSWWGIVGGVVVAIAMILTAGAITRPGAIGVGWTLQLIVALAAAGMGVALLPRMIAEDRRRPDVAVALLDEPGLDWHMALVWRRGAFLSHAAQAWLALVREHYGAAPAPLSLPGE